MVLNKEGVMLGSGGFEKPIVAECQTWEEGCDKMTL